MEGQGPSFLETGRRTTDASTEQRLEGEHSALESSDTSRATRTSTRPAGNGRPGRGRRLREHHQSLGTERTLHETTPEHVMSDFDAASVASGRSLRGTGSSGFRAGQGTRDGVWSAATDVSDSTLTRWQVRMRSWVHLASRAYGSGALRQACPARRSRTSVRCPGRAPSASGPGIRRAGVGFSTARWVGAAECGGFDRAVPRFGERQVIGRGESLGRRPVRPSGLANVAHSAE